MKILQGFLLCFIVSIANCFSQDAVPLIHLDSLPPQGISLNKGWKFHAGDDTAWASPYYDDSKWQIIDLGQYNNYFPSFKEKNIGWFRLKINIDSSQSNQASILLSHLGASDWYINGNLFIQFGKIKSGVVTENYNPHDKPVIFPANVYDTIVIAVRFASKTPQHAWMFTRHGTPPISIRLSPWMNALSEYKASLVQPRLHIGYSFMSAGIGLVFILLFTFFPREKTTLLFGLFCFCIGIIPVIESQLYEDSIDINSYGRISFYMDMIYKICAVLTFIIISLEVTKKMKLYQWLILFYVLIVDSLLLVYVGPAKAVSIIGNIAYAAFAIELLRLGVFAFIRGAYLAGLAALSNAFLHIGFVLSYFTTMHMSASYPFFNLLFTLVMLTIYFISKYARSMRYVG